MYYTVVDAMSFIHNQPVWHDHEEHRHYESITLFPDRMQRYFTEQPTEVQACTLEATNEATQLLSSPRKGVCMSDSHHSREIMIDLTRHHKIARELLKNREAYEDYDSELSALVRNLKAVSIAPDELIERVVIPVK